MLRLRQDIPLFAGGKKKAFTLSYDDGVSQDVRLIALLKKYGLQCTFNLNSGLMGNRDWLRQPGIDVSHYKLKREEIAEVYGGFELAVHTMTHPDLTRVPSSMTAYEVMENKKDLEAITRSPVCGMAYPFGACSGRVIETLKQCGISYARTTASTHGFLLPKDYLEWNPTCHHEDPDLPALTEAFLQKSPDGASPEPALFYVWGHSYEFDAHGQWEMIENFFRRVSGNPDVWYASNGEIRAYMGAVESLVYSATGDYIMNPSALDVWMQIDGKPYCIGGGKTAIIDIPE